MVLEVQITKTETFQKVLLSQCEAIKRLAEALTCLSVHDLVGTQKAIQEAMLSLGISLKAVNEDREGVTK